jgi:hypothetical protein
MRQGWENPRLHYNRITGEVDYTAALTMNDNREMAEALVPILYQGDWDEPRRREELTKALGDIQAGIAQGVAARGRMVVESAFAQLIGEKVLLPLNLKQDQEWFGVGLIGVLTAKYSSPLLGIPRNRLIEQMTYEPRGTPVRSAPIDLIHPTDPAALRRQYVPYYVDALRRKSTAVIATWTRQAGDQAIPKILFSLKQQMPPDGPGIVTRINQLTGIDLSSDVAPK